MANYVIRVHDNQSIVWEQKENSNCWHLNLLVSGTKIMQFVCKTYLQMQQAHVLIRTL